MEQTQKLSGKDIGILVLYGILLMVINFIVQFLGFIGPFFWVFTPAFAALCMGLIYFLGCAKYQRSWAVFIMTTVFAVLGLVMSWDSNFVYLLMYVLCILLPELIRKACGYRTFKGASISYIVFCLTAMTGPQYNIWLAKQWTYEHAAEEMASIDPTYADRIFSGFGAGWWMPVLIVAIIVCALLGTCIAKAVLKRSFQKHHFG